MKKKFGCKVNFFGFNCQHFGSRSIFEDFWGFYCQNYQNCGCKVNFFVLLCSKTVKKKNENKYRTSWQSGILDGTTTTSRRSGSGILLFSIRPVSDVAAHRQRALLGLVGAAIEPFRPFFLVTFTHSRCLRQGCLMFGCAITGTGGFGSQMAGHVDSIVHTSQTASLSPSSHLYMVASSNCCHGDAASTLKSLNCIVFEIFNAAIEPGRPAAPTTTALPWTPLTMFHSSWLVFLLHAAPSPLHMVH